MRARVLPLSPFGQLLTSICDDQGITVFALGAKIGIKSTAHMSNATRPHRNGTRQGLLTLEQMRAMCKVLNCDDDTKAKLIILGCLEFAPPILADYVEMLESTVEGFLQEKGSTGGLRVESDRIRLRTRTAKTRTFTKKQPQQSKAG